MEDAFQAWVAQDEKRKENYGDVMGDFKKYYEKTAESRANEALIYTSEMLMGSGILRIAWQTGELVNSFDSADFKEMVSNCKQRADKFYKSFNPELEKRLLVNMLVLYSKNVAPRYIPTCYADIIKKYKKDAWRYADKMFDKSIFASRERLMDYLDHPKKKRLERDMALEAANSFINSYRIARFGLMTEEERLNTAQRLYIAGLHEMNPKANYYPDANSTMRLTYGSVKAYKPADGLMADYYTTLTGVMEKEDSTNEEFIVSPKLKELYAKKDFGQYADNGTMRVCFLTTHDITGGNSGSPVMNGNGELIGLAFDGNSESMSSDIKYDANLQRTICVDIRYVLFVIDKYAGAGYLVDEMKKVR